MLITIYQYLCYIKTHGRKERDKNKQISSR